MSDGHSHGGYPAFAQVSHDDAWITLLTEDMTNNQPTAVEVTPLEMSILLDTREQQDEYFRQAIASDDTRNFVTALTVAAIGFGTKRIADEIGLNPADLRAAMEDDYSGPDKRQILIRALLGIAMDKKESA
jgi:hypothetical protein